MPCLVLAETSTIDGFAAHLLRDQLLLHQAGADHGRVGARLVDLVDGHQDGHLGRLRVLDGLDGLRHGPFFGRDHDDHDVGHLGAARAHGGEGLVAGRIQEHDIAVRGVNAIGPDVLGDAAGLAARDVGLANGVEQTRSCRGPRGP